MRRRKGWKPESNGQYTRNLGWKLDHRTGRYSQHKFYLGTDLKQAERRRQRLEELWELIEQRAPIGEKPTWTSIGLKIAKALARGELQIVVERGNNAPKAYASYLHRLATAYPMVSFVPEEALAYAEGSAANTKMVQEQIDAIQSRLESLQKTHQRTGNIRSALLPTHGGETLHRALDAYIEWIKTDRNTAWGKTRVGQAERLKERHADAPLSSLDYDACEALIRYWRNRPPRKGTDTPIAVVTAENHIYELKCFLRWLHRSQRFAWRKPEDFDEIETRVAETPQEIQARATTEQVETFTLEELCILNEYATPLERVLMLLGLNCGFGGAESGTLTLNQIFLHQVHPKAKEIEFQSTFEDSFIRRVRLKSKVYGEHLLWSQTVTCVQWAMERRQRLGGGKPDSLLIVSDRGEPLFHETKGGNYSRRIQNLWNDGLLKRVCMDHKDFRKLSFGKLRKTAGNLIKRFSDGETAGVFLCHGTPVRTDALSDVYTNRDFPKVFGAIREVESYLKPMFEAAPKDLVTQPPNQRIGRRITIQIKKLRDQGATLRQIAAELGVAVTTVSDHLHRNNHRPHRQDSP